MTKKLLEEKMKDTKNKKGFFETLKQTPKNLEEAKEKTKNLIILSAAVSLGVAALGALIHIIFGIIALIASSIGLASMYFYEMRKDKRNFCADCGARIDYENGVSWEVTDYDEKNYNTNSSSSGKQIVRKRIANVEFTCTCTECGSTRRFCEKYDVVLWYNDGTHKQNNIQTLAKNYFKI